MSVHRLVPPRTLPAADADLVSRSRSGDEQAFASIHARYRGPLEGYARRILGTRGWMAEDVVQEGFIRAHRALMRDDRPITLKPWLYMIVRNAAIDEQRRGAAEAAATLAARPGAPTADDAATVVIDGLRLREVLDGVGRLAPRQRTALVRHVFDGASHARIAAELDTSVSATKALLHRARMSVAQAA